MATHSGILAWIIPWREELGRLQSMGSQSQTRLSTCMHAHTHGGGGAVIIHWHLGENRG